MPDAHAVWPDVVCPSMAADSMVIRAFSPGPRSTPTVCFSHQPCSRRPSVCPASSLPVPGARVGGEGKEAGAPAGVYVRAPARGIAAHGGPESGPWGLGGSGKTGHRRLHQLLQGTVTPLTPAPAPRRAMGLVTIANTG